MANSNKTLSTIILSTFWGKKCCNFFFVIQKEALVFAARFLYFIESKNVKSDFSAVLSDFILVTIISFLKECFVNNFFILIFFFEKK